VGAETVWGLFVLLYIIGFIILVRLKGRRGLRPFDLGPGAYGSV
jgi:hypothetical protein